MPRHLSRQLFIASEQFVRAFSVEEVEASWRDMAEMGLAQLPYPEVDLVMPSSIVIRPRRETYSSPEAADAAEQTFSQVWKIKFRFTDYVGVDWFLNKHDNSWFSLDELNEPVFSPKTREYILDGAMKFLTVALATRNVVKTTTVNKAARLGIGRAAREGYAASTTLTVGQIDEALYERPGSHHASPRPHLRRGHIRRQHYGPNNELVKRIWVQPTFVNVDEEFVNRRTAYNLRPIAACYRVAMADERTNALAGE